MKQGLSAARIQLNEVKFLKKEMPGLYRNTFSCPYYGSSLDVIIFLISDCNDDELGVLFRYVDVHDIFIGCLHNNRYSFMCRYLDYILEMKDRPCFRSNLSRFDFINNPCIERLIKEHHFEYKDMILEDYIHILDSSMSCVQKNPEILRIVLYQESFNSRLLTNLFHDIIIL